MKSQSYAPCARLFPLAVAAMAIALMGCATTSARSRADATLAMQHGASPALTEKLSRNQILTLPEIVALKSLPDDVLIRHLQATGAIYTLTLAQVDQLREAGVSRQVIDYLLSTPRLLTYSYPRYHYYGSYGYWGAPQGYYSGWFGHGGHLGGFGSFGHHGFRHEGHH